ncbi:MAG: hypothetical protein JSS76_08820 [Bacteroidetes bacterium]|nr:hypothetical protein [Bacteroidota bacterium]
MGLFNLFKKKRGIPLPDAYASLISAADYADVIGIALRYHKEKQITVISSDDGDIHVSIDGQRQHRYLDNLVRWIIQSPKGDWKKIIYAHFDKFKDNSSAIKFFQKDFEHASPLLRVLIKNDQIKWPEESSTFLSRCDFPGTRTFIVIEFENQFCYISTKDIQEWEMPIDEIFDIAIGNTPAEEITSVTEGTLLDKFPFFLFLSGDFSASLMLDLPNRAPFAVGSYGTIIAIPTKGTAFAHPIESKNVLDVVVELLPTVEKFYYEDPGQITNNFYWSYNGTVLVLPMVRTGETTATITLPDELISLLNSI